MPELLILNPSKRPSKRKGAGIMKRRTAAQKAATKRLVAFNRSRKRASNPKKRRAKRRHNPIAAVKHSYRPARRRRNNPMSFFKRRKHAKRRRNPISLNNAINLTKEASIGAGGALLVDLIMGNLPLPANLVQRRNVDGSTNYLYYLTKSAFAVGIGMLPVGAWKNTMALGAMTVNMYDFFRTVMPAGIPLGYINTARVAGPPLGMYNNRKVGNSTPMATHNQQALSGNVNAKGFQSGINMYTGKRGMSMYTR